MNRETFFLTRWLLDLSGYSIAHLFSIFSCGTCMVGHRSARGLLQNVQRLLVASLPVPLALRTSSTIITVTVLAYKVKVPSSSSLER